MLKDNGFQKAILDLSLFKFSYGNIQILLLVYVDDMIVTSSSEATMVLLIEWLNSIFPLKILVLSFFFFLRD